MIKISKMSKKRLIDEAKAIQKMITPFLNANNAHFPIQEKTENFFKNLIRFLEKEGEKEKNEPDSLYNNIPTVKRNLEYLATKFTKDKKDIRESKEYKNIVETLDAIFSREIEKKIDKSL